MEKRTLYVGVAILVVFSCLLLFAEDVPFFALAVMAMLWVVVVPAFIRQELKEMFPGGQPGFTKRGDGSGALHQPDDPWADPYFRQQPGAAQLEQLPTALIHCAGTIRLSGWVK